MALEFLKPGDASYCVYHKERYLVTQYGRFCSYSDALTTKDWLCMRNNTPLKDVSLFNEYVYNKINKIIKIKL